MISSPNFEKPPVLISLLDPRDCWLVLAAEALEDAAADFLPSEAVTWDFMLL